MLHILSCWPLWKITTAGLEGHSATAERPAADTEWLRVPNLRFLELTAASVVCLLVLSVWEDTSHANIKKIIGCFIHVNVHYHTAQILRNCRIYATLHSQIFIFHSGIQQWLPWEHWLFKMLSNFQTNLKKNKITNVLSNLSFLLKLMFCCTCCNFHVLGKKVTQRGINSRFVSNLGLVPVKF